MATVTLKICDHCDCRDNVEFPPVHDIRTISIRVNIALSPPPVDITPDLCAKCRDTLVQTIFKLATQEPRQAQ